MWWVKYRVKSSASKGEWQWKPLYMETASRPEARAAAVMALESIGEMHNWSEHYRGIDFHVYEIAPEEVVTKHRDAAVSDMNSAHACVLALTRELTRSRRHGKAQAQARRLRRKRSARS